MGKESEKQRFFLGRYWLALNNDYSKRLFINIIRQIHLETTGVLHDKSLSLFKGLQYNPFIRAYLSSPYLRNNLFALKNIRDFRLEGYEKYIYKFTKSRNNILRSAALVTLIRFEPYNNLAFLADNEIEITLWDINNILTVVQQSDLRNIDYQVLIESANSETCVLGIILARLNQRVDLKEMIKEKTMNGTDLVSEEALLTFISFVTNQNDYDFLCSQFGKFSDMIKLSILKIMPSYPIRDLAIYFLKLIVETDSVVIKSVALKVLSEIDITQVVQFKNSDNEIIKSVYYQTFDFNI